MAPLGAQREQVTLNPVEHRVDIARNAGGPSDAETRVRFIDLAVGIHTRIGFRDARAPEESRLTGIAGLCVDLHATIIVKPT